MLRVLRDVLTVSAVIALAWLAYSAAALDQLRRYARRAEHAHREETP